jgi:hypothetical protein
MAQGPLKKTKPSTAKRYASNLHIHNFPQTPGTSTLTTAYSLLTMIMIYSPTALAPKRGPRQIAPKKATLIKQQKITKVRIYNLYPLLSLL